MPPTAGPPEPLVVSDETPIPSTHSQTFIFTESSSVVLRAALSVRERNLILSRASEALEIISRKKIYRRDTFDRRGYHTHHQLTSLLRQSELMMSFIIRFTSAWNVNFSALSLSSFISATLSPSNLIASSSLISNKNGSNVIGQFAQRCNLIGRLVPLHGLCICSHSFSACSQVRVCLGRLHILCFILCSATCIKKRSKP